ncbi:hypothetical protein [Ruania rhizosphaerae]|uniref:hypothetical protein n=1 Tax=Ruania rhizosphaerae TaxID=1840413 RepID=UPI001357FB1D|nr:hypothetical protein [Ruania rhizosphaerae]
MLPALAERPTAQWADQAREVDVDIRKRAPELKPALVAPWTDHARLYKDNGDPWLVTPYDTDPEGRRLPVPQGCEDHPGRSRCAWRRLR